MTSKITHMTARQKIEEMENLRWQIKDLMDAAHYLLLSAERMDTHLAHLASGSCDRLDWLELTTLTLSRLPIVHEQIGKRLSEIDLIVAAEEARNEELWAHVLHPTREE